MAFTEAVGIDSLRLPERPVALSSTASAIKSNSPTHSNRPHSSSISSVHFAPTLSHRLPSSGSGLSHDTIPLPRNATEPLISPPKTPTSTTRLGYSPNVEIPHLSQAGRRSSAASGSVLAHGKRASVVTGGYESSSSESPSGTARSTRRRATTIASTIPMSRSSSDKNVMRDSKVPRLSTSRHSSRDILRSTVLRPVHPAAPLPPSRIASNRSNVIRNVSPAQRDRLRPIVTSSPDSSRSRKGKERADPRRDLLASSLGFGTGSNGPVLTSGRSSH